MTPNIKSTKSDTFIYLYTFFCYPQLLSQTLSIPMSLLLRHSPKSLAFTNLSILQPEKKVRIWLKCPFVISYSVLHRFGQAKFVNIVSILSPSQISLLPQLCQKNEACVKSGQNRHKNNHLATYYGSTHYRLTSFAAVIYLRIRLFTCQIPSQNVSFYLWIQNASTANNEANLYTISFQPQA